MKSPVKKRRTPGRKTSPGGPRTVPPSAKHTSTTTPITETIQTMRPKPQVPYEEPLPFIPYRPVPASAMPRRAAAGEVHTPDRTKLQEVLRLADEAAAALREVAGPDYNTDVAIRARLSSLANHLEEVARYITRAYR